MTNSYPKYSVLTCAITKQGPHQLARWDKDSKLHKFKPTPDPKGNRAERREHAKRYKRGNR